MRFRHLFKSHGLGVNLLASFCFLLLAVYGWGLTWEELGRFLLVLLVLLGGVIAAAAFFGWLLRKIMRRCESSLTDSSLLDESSEKKDQDKTR